MKALKILLSLVMVVIFALSITEGAAMAASVNISGAISGTYTLNSMSIDSNGNITLNVSGGTPPPPGALSLSLNPTTLPSGTINTAYNQNVTMAVSGGTSPYNYNCSGSGVAGITASASGSTCIISGTPTASGTYTVNFSVTDSVGAKASASISFNVSAGTTPPPSNCTTLQNRVNVDAVISANGLDYYCFVLDNDYSTVGIAIFTGDWATNQDIMMSNRSQPSWDDYNTYVKTMIAKYGYALNRDPLNPPWYKTSPINTESIMIYNVNGKKGQIFYVTVFNMSPSQGRYTIQATWY